MADSNYIPLQNSSGPICRSTSICGNTQGTVCREDTRRLHQFCTSHTLFYTKSSHFEMPIVASFCNLDSAKARELSSAHKKPHPHHESQILFHMFYNFLFSYWFAKVFTETTYFFI